VTAGCEVPILVGERNTQGQRPPKNAHPLDLHYHNLKQEMRRMFKTLKIAA
jgi:hypothetical protein